MYKRQDCTHRVIFLSFDVSIPPWNLRSSSEALSGGSKTLFKGLTTAYVIDVSYFLYCTPYCVWYFHLFRCLCIFIKLITWAQFTLTRGDDFSVVIINKVLSIHCCTRVVRVSVFYICVSRAKDSQFNSRLLETL